MFNLQKDLDSIEFWEGAKKGKLMIQQCNHTNNYFLYSRINTPLKNDLSFKWIEASGKGTIYSFTISHIPGGSKYYIDKTPYIIASILLEEGVRLTSNIISKDFKEIKIGKDVKVKFIKLTDEITFPCFVLV